MRQFTDLACERGAAATWAIKFVIVAFFWQFSGFASAAGHEAVPALNLGHDGKIALRGYDPVGYFRQHSPQKGDDTHRVIWQNATWKFASAANQKAFLANPKKYAPSYGGYCAFAISRGLIADADPHCWAVVSGHLYLNNNPFAQKLWEANRRSDIQAGDQNWQRLPKRPISH